MKGPSGISRNGLFSFVVSQASRLSERKKKKARSERSQRLAFYTLNPPIQDHRR
jgi:hypothetical protein